MKNSKTLFFLLTTLCSLLATFSFAQVDTAWVRRYNGPGNNFDNAYAIAVDDAGNVYVTGRSYVAGTDFDYATIMYNSAGEILWVRRYNGSANGWDEAHAIAVDDSGNVYATGNSVGSGTGRDYTTIKYNSVGDTVWIRRYDGPGSGDDGANALIIDGVGNVYVTGFGSVDSGTSFDYATIKYNPNGDTDWIRLYNGPGNYVDVAYAIATDGTGNVYVTGTSDGDYTTIKYDLLGETLWVRQYNGPGNGLDEAHTIAVDDSGSVYVTGWSPGPGTYNDYATVKYNSSGVEQWVSRYNGPVNDNDGAFAIAVDCSGNVCVTGRSYGAGTSYDYATIMYNFAGVQQWVKRYNGPGNYDDGAFAIAIDSSGYIYVTGFSYGAGTLNDYVTIKYNSAGDQQWMARYNGQINSDDEARGITLDVSGNVYVTGWSIGSGSSQDYATIKYIQTQGIEESNETNKLINDNFTTCPNPMKSLTVIRYSLSAGSKVSLNLYDISGRLINTLVDEYKNPGNYILTLNTKTLSAGIYFLSLESNEKRIIERLIVIK